MRVSLVAVLVCLTSGVALAQETGASEKAEAEKAAPEPAASEKAVSSGSEVAPRRAPTWSMGAGVSLGGATVSVPMYLSGLLVTNYLMNQANLTLERSIGPADWLFFDLVGSYSNSSSETKRNSGYSSSYQTETTGKSAGALVGLRHVFSASQWVNVSGWVGAAFSWAQYEITSSNNSGLGGLANPKQTTELKVVSGQAGLALDREVVPGLAVRLSVPVLQAMHAWGVERQKDTPDDDLTVSGFGLRITPSLEVHMLF